MNNTSSRNYYEFEIHIIDKLKIIIKTYYMVL